MMTFKMQVIAILISLVFLFIIFELIRRRKLKPEYSIFWLLVGLIMLVFSVFKNLLDKLAGFLGIFSPPLALFMIGLVFIVIILLYLFVLISEFSSDRKEIFKEISILRWKIEELEKRNK